MKSRTLPAIWVSLGAAMALVSGTAIGESVPVASDQIARLGIVVARPAAVADMEIASVPAEIVIPPAQQAAITAPVSGVITRLFVATGESVSAGQALAELSSNEFMQIQREFLDALANDELAQAQLTRDNGLMADGIIARRRLEETTADARAAKLRRSQTYQQLTIAGLGSAAIDRLIERRELSASLTLRATLDGVVIEQLSNVGDSVTALAPVLRIADLDQLWVEAHVPQEVAASLAPGMRMTTSTGARRMDAGVTTIGRVVDPVTQTVLVRATFDNAATGFSAGQFLTVAIMSAAESDAAFAIPSSAVTRNGDQTHVFARSADGFNVLPVDVLSEDGERSFVSGDISLTSEIAVDGVSALKSLWLTAMEGED